MMKVLVACEYSGVVRDAFLTEGHDAISCDLLPTESPGPHIQGDVRPLLRERWDLVIAHPPCQRLTKLNDAHPGNRKRKGFWLEFADSVRFFEECRSANAPKVAVENPLMHKFARKAIGPYSQLVQPWYFGDPYKKATAFWLKGLPPLMATLVVPNPKPLIGQMVGGRPRAKASDGSDAVLPDMWSGINRGSARSRFHPGMAAAMALQWGRL